ncbi:D-alanyl-D-alanine dipeptidase [Mucilaginibacter hurinus]|uniref:D-alanyl-D-alanine dipeptidase n=1 Tax=Mucilaginibacter hurinus TaxID=2201324 RepID=A0A367GSE8_9SPHI|nr:M15 family metallopeptidase [Mucilaginibacter hurinus]RCH55643.1 D-alanyl-D-alanine dipeptidase [Mucilaginibacter hurinus]
MKRWLISGYLFVVSFTVSAQTYKYIDSSKVIGLKGYKAYLNKNHKGRLVEITQIIPDIKLDIRYATTNNFTGQQVYREARAFARLPVVKALAKVQAELKNRGMALKIFDAYRPYSVTLKFYEIAKDTTYVADPRKGSRHNRGCAIDLTLIDLKNGQELDMPTGYDSFEKAAWAYYTNLSAQQIKNRDFLRSIMEKYHFTVYPTEWWHFDFKGWEDYELMDIPFESL